MASYVRISAVRNISRLWAPRAPRFVNQRRWAQVHDVRFLATTRPSQAIIDKYREKLNQKAKTEGFKDIEELKSAYSDKIKETRAKDAVEFPIPQAPNTPVGQSHRGPLPESKLNPLPPDSGVQIPQAPNTPVSQPNKHGPTPSTPGSPAVQAARRASGSEKPAIKGLNDIIDLEKCRGLPEKELTMIWRLRHAQSPQKICAVVPASTYKAMEEAAKRSPQFVLPVPHEGQGAEMHFLQWTFDSESRTSTVLFTQLAEYRARGEFAQPHTTITHHLDLLDERGLVMMQGQLVDGRGVKPEQAKWLVMCLQRFYGAWESNGSELTGERKVRAEERRALLNWFSTGDERFTVERLLDEAERIG
ncbi:ATP synthase mitochondrial F1 complex assembly factor 1 [Geosmithia morbida]|uniref:ATP synthase mitochondrial F1 complex assembly factor 1 n=1 Tax=Geosmithia morbida TaxID=1094350 RepID=A0A9P4YTQ3_9HYPO|nr:ATP synthase mitochondrial F1 complex assembly factor 1 [Geosmithia morbida]KAF4122933.1 ATP synthase mitochondrial F1 complex assembly factor 1 [Geosmithia morbida]